MTEEQFLGIIKPEEEKELGKMLDDIVDFKKVFDNRKWLGIGIEAVDGKFFTAAIRNIDDKLIEKIPPDYKPLSRQLLLATINKDWETVVVIAPELLNKPIDIPGIDEDVELAILSGLVQAVYLAINAYAHNEIKK